ncbi:MAG: Smr/MutS family protein [Chitinophagales bacterium]
MKKNKEYIRVGDTVRMIFTDETGIVLSYLDAETLIVEIDGEDIPVFAEHLEKVAEIKPNPTTSNKFPQSFKAKKKPMKRAELQRKKVAAMDKLKEMGLQTQTDNEPDRGLKVALQPFYDDTGDITYFLIHLINDSGYTLQFDYQFNSIEGLKFELKKKRIGGREPMILNSINYDSLNDQPQLQFKFELLKKNEKGLKKVFEKTIKPKAKMLRRSPEELSIIAGKAYSYALFHQLPKKPKKAPTIKNQDTHLDKLKSYAFQYGVEKQDFTEKVYINAEERIIDLHIEKLSKSYRHLTKTHILLLQLKECQKSIEQAIKRKEKNMVVIHGIGRGKLKKEVFKLLMNYQEVKNFKNEYNHRYGFGATEIFFEYEEN